MDSTEKAHFAAAAQRILGHSLEPKKVKAIARIHTELKETHDKILNAVVAGMITSETAIARDLAARNFYEKENRAVLGDADYTAIFERPGTGKDSVQKMREQLYRDAAHQARNPAP